MEMSLCFLELVTDLKKKKKRNLVHECGLKMPTKVHFHSEALCLLYNQNVIDYFINKTLNICHKGKHAHYHKEWTFLNAHALP